MAVKLVGGSQQREYRGGGYGKEGEGVEGEE